MIAVLFEVTPAVGKRDVYLGIAAELRPLLETIDGFSTLDDSLAAPVDGIDTTDEPRGSGALNDRHAR
jgi:hypothetical protein